MLAMASPPGKAVDQEGRRHLSPGDAGAGADTGESSFDFGFLRDGTPPVQQHQQQQHGPTSHKAAVSGVKSGSGGGRGAMTKASGDKRAFPFSLRKKKKDIPVMDDMMLDDENSFASPALMGIAAAPASSELKTALTAKRDALMLAPVTPLRRSPFADKTNLAVIRNSLEKSGDGNTEIDSSSKTLLKQNNMRLVERLSCADDELRSLKEALRSKECGVTAMLKVLGEQSTSHIALEAENGELQNQINMMAAEVMELQRQLTSLQVRRVQPSSNGHTPRSSLQPQTSSDILFANRTRESHTCSHNVTHLHAHPLFCSFARSKSDHAEILEQLHLADSASTLLEQEANYYKVCLRPLVTP